jgi:hypothetical protein
MTLPLSIKDRSLPVKWFLTSYRALSDARSGIQHLDEYLQAETYSVSDWKVIWVGSCSLLRTCIDLFQLDSKSCIDAKLRDAISTEWSEISSKDRHPIFWQFLRRERDNILHEYEWVAYKAWLNAEGDLIPDLSLLSRRPADGRSVVMMSSGYYEGRDSLELLHEGAQWVEDRIHNAIRRAGYEPDEERRLHDFTERPKPERFQGGILSGS